METGKKCVCLRKRGYVKGLRLMQQQRVSVFTQAYVCERRCLHQRGTVTAACHIEAP